MEEINTYALLKDPEMKEILDSFLVETKEILENLDLDLVTMETQPDDNELLNKVFRSFHTIKGTSGFLGLDKLTKVTHRCEDILNKLRKGEARVNQDIMDSILLAFDKIKELIVTIETELNEDVETENVISTLNKTIDNLQTGESPKTEAPVKQPAKTKKAVSKKTSKNSKKQTTKTKVSAAASNRKKSKNSEKSNTHDNPEKQEKPKDGDTLQVLVEPEMHKETKEIKNPEPSINKIISKESKESNDKNLKQVDNTIRVDIERLDELLNIASELVLGRNRLAQVNSEFALEYEGTKLSRDLSEASRQIDLMTNELQLIVMKTRMVKIGKVFNRFPRVVRDLARDSGKKVKLELKGEETELDKTLIEEINDPLVHLVRNSIDHGIELPEDRKSSGKDEAGTITLSALHEGNHIIIVIEDDGKGIDPEVIREKAISKGILTPEKAKELSLADTYNLIFLPGFSTAEKVTSISGRGVGMDVVKTNVTKLRGLINIESGIGKGTKIIIKLPLTLAIIPGMIVKVKEELFVIPLNSVLEVVRVHRENINTINQREVIRMRDRIITLLDIDELTHVEKYKTDDKIWQYVVIVGIAEKIFGIKVDKLIGQKEIVIKSMGSYLGNVEGIAGSTIMGDGTVIMILDLSELINKLDN
jgi:two-component system, chemotaxis family, sensor kinase CheA